MLLKFMNITFRQLRLFLALADSGSVSAAARRMHVTQPAASMQLKEISQQVGMPLYELVGKKLSLTEAGLMLAQTARQITHNWESFEQEIDAFQGLSRGKIRIAVVSTAKYFMPRLVGSFCKLYPNIDIALEILNRDSVVHRLRENRDDFYIMSMPPGDLDLGVERFMENPIVVITSSNDPISKRKNLSLNDLRKHRFILREKGSGTRMAADRFFRARRFQPDIRLELGSNEAVKESVAGGLGLGVLSRHALHGQEGEHGVRTLQVEGFPLASAWHIVHPSAKKLSPLAQAFKQHIMLDVSTKQVNR
jgi:DNA-binding transcriptional LysR family regulator